MVSFMFMLSFMMLTFIYLLVLVSSNCIYKILFKKPLQKKFRNSRNILQVFTST